MASTSSISGLGSGLDTASIIDQLMQLEAVPQNKLKTNLTTQQSTLKVLQTLNAKVAALTTQAQDLAKGIGWNALAATSSSSAVSVSTTGGTSSGSFVLTVDQTAVAHQLSFATTAASGSSVVVGGGTSVDLTVKGVTTTLDTGDGTLDGLINAVNTAGLGISASKVKIGPDSYRLVVGATSTGDASQFTLTNAGGSDLLGGATARVGRDAAIVMGTDRITSASNTFSGVVPGLDFTISAAATGPVELTVARDTTAVKNSVKALVTAINDTLGQIDAQSTYNATTRTAGALAGDPGVRTLRTALLSSVYPADGTSMADLGLQTDRYGKLVLDEATFGAAYDADPAKVAARFTSGASQGFAARVAAVASSASDKYTGSITATITGRTDTITRLQHSIDDWDTRLEMRRTSLTRQYSALDTALNKLNSQSSWLAGQISSLTRSS